MNLIRPNCQDYPLDSQCQFDTNRSVYDVFSQKPVNSLCISRAVELGSAFCSLVANFGCSIQSKTLIKAMYVHSCTVVATEVSKCAPYLSIPREEHIHFGLLKIGISSQSIRVYMSPRSMLGERPVNSILVIHQATVSREITALRSLLPVDRFPYIDISINSGMRRSMFLSCGVTNTRQRHF